MLEAVNTVIPMQVERHSPVSVDAPLLHVKMGVLVGVTGQSRGRLLLESDEHVFGKVAEQMYGMALEGDMLESFVGELGNMIAGTMSTQVSQAGILIDITPPTVIVGDTKFTGFGRALSVPLTIADAGDLRMLLILEE
jgi:chemotaxis protein CheX